MRRLGAGDDEQARRVPVEPVHDPRPVGVASSGPERQQPVGQRRSLVGTRGMDDEAGGLVDHEQVRVLVDDLEPELERRQLAGLGYLDAELLPPGQPVALRPAVAVDEDGPPFTSRSASVREPTPGRPRRRRRAVCPRPTQERESGEVPTAALERSAATNETNRSPTPTTMNVSARLNAGQ